MKKLLTLLLIALSWPALADTTLRSPITFSTGLTVGNDLKVKLANPSSTTLGGIESFAAQSNKWINSISTSGIPGATQPACADLSDAASGCSTAALSTPIALSLGGTHANLSATGGASQVLKQSSSGADITVGTLACADLSDDGAGCTAGAASTSTAGIAKLHNVPLSIGWPAALNPNNTIIAVVNQASTISAIIGAVETATGSAATVSVSKAPSGTACSAGTVLHSGSFNANGTAATNQTLTVTTSTVAAGDRLCLQTTGTTSWTGGTGIGTISVFLAPTP